MTVQQNACDACGAPRYKADGKPAKQMTYWSLTSWLAHLLGDPEIGKSMLENMAAARKAAEEGADYYHAKKNPFPPRRRATWRRLRHAELRYRRLPVLETKRV